MNQFIFYSTLWVSLLFVSPSFAYLTCADNAGRQIIYQESYSSNQAAVSNVNGYGQPIVIVNPSLFNQLSIAQRIFVNAHECAHHYYGHIEKMVMGIPRNEKTDEFDADCFAVRYMRDTNQLSQQGFDQVKSFLSGLHEDSSHPAGAYRVQYAVQCVNTQ